ncbi:transporter substrate-binding domain-containing protein [Rhizobiaceae bacterium BDR2-2]|uniref:Transporter substrate-binding domain-containing protein n=1 Tax=Ectorhizobium quercum TaxID=2965071 RepID=A0AAE3N4A6_9HYPH|nr:transporter substrate-binding domain-containing protein [Ectorhizobium quercum]MCX8999732.1 transporter substrate-binding domain-containing protein [Ectorhizobium quercum]
MRAATKRRSTISFPHAACLALLAIFVMSAGATPSRAQDEDAPSLAPVSGPLTVGVYVHPPFVMKNNDGFTGMAVDLWEWLAGQLGLESEYVELDTLADLVDAVETGTIDIAVTNLTITRGRAERVDFTHPWFDAGQRIMVDEDRGASFLDVVAGLRESGHLRAYSWIAFVIVVATILVTLFDRHFDKDFPRRWRDGFAESFYTVMSVATSGKPPSRRNLFGWIGRIWQGLWLVCGIAVLAYVTSSVTSVMTTLSLTNQINSVADLPGRPVGVQTGSVSEEYARERGLNLRLFAHTQEAVEALLSGEIAAIVGDAPVLEYHAHIHPQQPVAVVGPIFAPDKYGFALPLGSALTRPLTVELIGAHESGLIAEIRTRYFGNDP